MNDPRCYQRGRVGVSLPYSTQQPEFNYLQWSKRCTPLPPKLHFWVARCLSAYRACLRASSAALLRLHTLQPFPCLYIKVLLASRRRLGLPPFSFAASPQMPGSSAPGGQVGAGCPLRRNAGSGLIRKPAPSAENKQI